MRMQLFRVRRTQFGVTVLMYDVVHVNCHSYKKLNVQVAMKFPALMKLQVHCRHSIMC
jgi:hypothetical protein